MANPRVVELRQQAHPAAPRSTQKKRRRPEHTTSQRSASGENDAAAANQSRQSIQQSKRHRRRVRRSGRSPRPEDVIVIDSDGEEPATCPATTAAPSSSGSSAHTRPARASAAAMEQLDSDDYFEVLGLSRDASDADVKKAYRKLAIQWHPDKNREHPRAEEFFKKIGEAYAVLSDPEKRAAYERYGKSGLNAGSSGSPDRSSRGSPDDFGFYGPSEFSARRARDIFEAFFGGMDPFAELFGGHTRRASRHSHAQSHGFPMDDSDDDIGDHGFGPAFVMPMMMGLGRGGMGVSVSFGGSRRGFGGMGGMGGMGGFGGGGLLDSFFSDEFPGFGAAGTAGGRGFASHSVSTSSFTDRNGQTVTKKTTTTVSPEGRTETVTEEYRNGNLVNSSSRLAGAGRMQLDSGGAASPAPSSRDGQRRLQSGGRSRSNRAL